MRTVVYLDVLLIVNFIIDYFLLLLAALTGGSTVKKTRLFLGAAVGAASSLTLLLPALHTAVNVIFKICVSAFVVLAAFGFKGVRRYLKNYFLYIISNIVFGGAVILYIFCMGEKGIEVNNLNVYFNISPFNLIAAVVAVYAVIKGLIFLFGTPKKEKICRLKLTFENATAEVETFWDTGFRLTDCMKQCPVILLSLNSLGKEFSALKENARALLCKNSYIENENNMYLIAADTVSGSALLPAVALKEVSYTNAVGKKTAVKGVTAAFCDKSFENGCDAITGSDVFNKLNF